MSLLAVPSLAVLGTAHDAVTSHFVALETAYQEEASGSSTTTPPGPTPPGATTTTTSAPAPTTTTTTTTTAPPPTTTVPPTTTTTTVPPTTTTTTTVPPTTTTTAPPPPTTTTIPGAPAFQSETVYTDGGWLEFELEDGEINLVDYDLERFWRGDLTRNPDGSITVHLWHRWNGQEVWVHAYVDSTGYLIVTVS